MIIIAFVFAFSLSFVEHRVMRCLIMQPSGLNSCSSLRRFSSGLKRRYCSGSSFHAGRFPLNGNTGRRLLYTSKSSSGQGC